MSTISLRLLTPMMSAALCLGAALPRAAHAATAPRLSVSASPQGSVEIVDVSGSVDIEGWERQEVEVTGVPDDLAERVRLSQSGDKTTINVMPYSLRDHSDRGESDAEIHLVVHVPSKSSVTTSLVSASLTVKGLEGESYLRTISGSIGAEVNGNLRVNTVTGTVRAVARAAQRIEVRTISGNMDVTGGSGEAELSTVSGKVRADLGNVSRARFKSISGEVTANFGLAPGGEVEGESVSGAIRFGFATAPGAAFDVQSFSGTIDNCFGPKPTEAQYGPGSKLDFTNGDGHGSVRIATKSGDVKLCTGNVRS